MVTLRGKKANAKPKSGAAPPADKLAAALAASVGSSGTAAAPAGKAKGAATAQQTKAAEQQRQREEERQAAQQRQKEERVLQLLQFATRAALAQRPPTAAKDATTETLNTLLTALCGSGKDKRASPAQLLEKLTRNVRKRVCGAIFSSDEIAYSCRDCQVDSTCVICQDCFAHRYAGGSR